MKKVYAIAKRELASFFDSLIAYILLIAFLGFSGFFTWLFGSDIFLQGQASLSTFFTWAYLILVIFIPLITMRMFAEERRTGTLDLMLTKAVSDRQLVLGKFLACLILIAIALLCTTPYWLTVSGLGNLDHGTVIAGYVALLLLSAAYIGVGLYASSTTNNQIVAALLSFFICLFFHLFFGVLAAQTSGVVANVSNYLSANTHFDSMIRGVIDSKNLIYFLSIAALGIVLSEMNLAKRMIKGS